MEILKKIRDFVVYSVLFTIFSFIRYFPTKWLDKAPPVSQPMGGDAHYYAQGVVNIEGDAAGGHFLTLAFSEVAKFLAPDSIQGLFLAGFFSLILTWAIYFLVKSEIERPWIVFVLVPFGLYVHRALTNGGYAQPLALSFFLIAFILWRKDRSFLSGLSLAAAIASHIWSGFCLFLVFMAYIFLHEDYDWSSLKERWHFFIPFVPLLFFLAWQQELWIYWIKFFLEFQLEDANLISCIMSNPTNMENIGILGLAGIGTLFIYFKDRVSETWQFVGVWTLVLSVLMVAFWGAQTFRIWILMPFVLPAVYAFDKMLEKGYILPTVILLVVCIISGWCGI